MAKKISSPLPSTDDGIPYFNAYCHACFDLQGNGDLLEIIKQIPIA